MNGINRMQFLGRNLCLFVAVLSISMLLVPMVGDEDALITFAEIAMIPFNFYFAALRCDNIAWSRWWTLLLLVPIAGMVFYVALYFVPPKDGLVPVAHG